MPERAYAITWREARAEGGRGRRVRFAPAAGDDRDARYVRITEAWTGCTWRETGREPVRALGIEIQAGAEVQTP